MVNPFSLDYNNMTTDFINNGISAKDIDYISDIVEKSKKAMNNKLSSGLMDFRLLPFKYNDVVDDIINYSKTIRDNENIEAFILLGIGGSALGPLAVHQALKHPFYNELTREQRGAPKLYILDNIDPEKLTSLFDIVSPCKCIFNVVSKSGSTSETMSQFMIIKKLLEDELGDIAKKHIVCTTDKEKGSLINIAKKEGYKTYTIPEGVGGRFSELSCVGLLAACVCGIDINALLNGAAYMDELCKNENIYENPAYMFAILNYISIKKNRNIVVIMPYADSLKYISDWFAQLWAESLGKKLDLDGNIVNAGSTPVKALGVTDQHSQIQLYTEGPDDKIIVMLGLNNYRSTLCIPAIYEDVPGLSFLGGITHNKLIQTEQYATEYSLTRANRSNMTITLDKVDEYSIGALLQFFEIATAFCGELLNINTFDQPGVEEGKNVTYAMLGRTGFEHKAKELNLSPKKKNIYII